MQDTRFEEICDALSKGITESDKHVNMMAVLTPWLNGVVLWSHFEASAPVILDDVLKVLWKIVEYPPTVNDQVSRSGFVVPELKFPTDWIQIVNPTAGRELWLTENINYYVTPCAVVEQKQGEPFLLWTDCTNLILFSERCLSLDWVLKLVRVICGIHFC